MSFDLDKFTAEPSVELLNLGKKTDLLNLAKHYKLSEIKSSMRKHEIKNILVQYFVDEEIFNEKELKRCIQSDVKTFLDEKQVETLEEAARLADDYYLTYKVSFIAKPKLISSHPQNKFMSGNSSGMPSQSNTPKPNSTSETKSQYPLS